MGTSSAESSADTGEACAEGFFLQNRFERPYGLVGKLEDDGFPMVATAWVNSGKTQGPHKVIETVTPARRIAFARACSAIFVVSADFDNLFNVVKDDVEDGGSHFRTHNPDRLPHRQHTVFVWHPICSTFL